MVEHFKGAIDSEMDSIVEAVREHAWRRPGRAAILFEGSTITYRQLYADVERFAYALTHWGLQVGDRVALYVESCPELIVAYLGTQLAGGVAVLVYSHYRQAELSHIVNDSGARLCVTDIAGRRELASLDLPALTALVLVGTYSDTDLFETPLPERLVDMSYVDFITDGSASDEQEPDRQLALPDADMAAVIVYTAGTTGRARGALLFHRNLVANIQAVSTAWRWHDDDHLLLTLPLSHTYGLLVGVNGTLYNGARLTLQRKFDASVVLAALAEQRQGRKISLFFGVPTMYARLLATLKEEPQLLSAGRPRLFVSSEASLDSQTVADFVRLFRQPILECYGTTETGLDLANPYEGERRPGSVGKPLPGQEARIVDRQTREPLSVGEIGEVEVRGQHIFKGYWLQPRATAKVFSPDGWFRTGDLGWRSEDGYFTITGRI